MYLLIENLAGAFTGSGFAPKMGRHPSTEDCHYLAGPLYILINLENQKIESISEDAPSENLPSINRFDATGLVASAGFIDSHTHSLFTGTRAREYFMRWAGLDYIEVSRNGGGIHNTFSALEQASEDLLLTELLVRLQKMREAGTTCVEVKSGYARNPEGELRLLRLIKKAKNDSRCPVRIKSTFLPLHALPQGQQEDVYIKSMIEILPTVISENLADHVDAFPEEGFFSLEQSLHFAREALKLGLRSKVHADELTPMGCVENFTPLQALSVDHLQKISKAGIDSLACSDTVATLLPATSLYLDLEYAPGRRLIDAGARVALASDYNPGTAPHSALQLTALLGASKMHLSAAELFAGLTYNAAASMALEKEQGSLEVGKLADICLWKTTSTPESNPSGQALLEEIFVESLKPEFSFLGGKGIFSQYLKT